MRKLHKRIFTHWLIGNFIFMIIFSWMYWGGIWLNTSELDDISFKSFLIVMMILSIGYTSIFTVLDYYFIFKPIKDEIKEEK